jgi:hypothetical protein
MATQEAAHHGPDEEKRQGLKNNGRENRRKGPEKSPVAEMKQRRQGESKKGELKDGSFRKHRRIGKGRVKALLAPGLASVAIHHFPSTGSTQKARAMPIRIIRFIHSNGFDLANRRLNRLRIISKSPAPKDVKPSHDQSLQTKEPFSVGLR